MPCSGSDTCRRQLWIKSRRPSCRLVMLPGELCVFGGHSNFLKISKLISSSWALSRLSLTVHSLRCQIIQFSRVIFKSRPNCLGSLGVRLLGRGCLRTSACFYYPILSRSSASLSWILLLVGVVPTSFTGTSTVFCFARTTGSYRQTQMKNLKYLESAFP